jgi:hypothetical protein
LCLIASITRKSNFNSRWGRRIKAFHDIWGKCLSFSATN